MQISKYLIRRVMDVLAHAIGDDHPCPRCDKGIKTNRPLVMEATKVLKELRNISDRQERI